LLKRKNCFASKVKKMIAAFSTLGKLKDYVKTLYSKVKGSDEPNNANDIIVFKATVRGEEFSQGNPPVSNSIYGVAIPQRSKVQILKEYGSEEQLKELFPTLPSEVVDKVWEQQGHSWSSCLGILNSLLLSHEVVILDNLDNFFKDENWPTLMESSKMPQKKGEFSGTTGFSVDEWVMLQMESFISNPESLPASMPSQQKQEIKSSGSSSSSSMLKDKSNISKSSSSMMNEGKPLSSGPTPYKDHLLHPSGHGGHGGDSGSHFHDKENISHGSKSRGIHSHKD